MKTRHLILAIPMLLGAGCVAASSTQADATYPEPTNYVVDAAGAIPQEVEDALNADLKTFDDKGQIAVAVVSTTAPLTIEQYGIGLAEKWKVGHEGKDDGVILILAVGDRQVRIEVGYGAEALITDAEAGRILDTAMIPYLKQNDWASAITAGVKAIQSQMTQ